MKIREKISKVCDKACDKISDVVNDKGDAIFYGGLGFMTGGVFEILPHEFGHAIADYSYSGKFPSFGFDSEWYPATYHISNVESVGNSGMAIIRAAGSAGDYIAGALLGIASTKIENPCKKLFVKGAALAHLIQPFLYAVDDFRDNGFVGDFDKMSSDGIPYDITIPSTGMLSLGLSYLLLKHKKDKLESKLKRENEGVKERENIFKEYSGKVCETLNSSYEKARKSFGNYL